MAAVDATLDYVLLVSNAMGSHLTTTKTTGCLVSAATDTKYLTRGESGFFYFSTNTYYVTYHEVEFLAPDNNGQ